MSTPEAGTVVQNGEVPDPTVAESTKDQDDNPQERLLFALQHNRIEEFRALLNNAKVKPDFKYGKPHFATCLEIACRRTERGEFVKALLKIPKVRPNINTIIPEPIHYAAKVGSYDAMKQLLQHRKIDVNAVDSRGDTALHYLALHYNKDHADRYKQCMALLITRYDIDINKPNKKGYTPIHQAAFYDRREMVLLILKHRKDELDLDSHHASGRTARTYILKTYPDLCQSLPLIKYNISRGYQNPLLVAFQNQHIDVFRGLLRQVDVDGNPLFDPNFWYDRPLNATCLEMACREDCSAKFVEALLEAGANPSAVNKNTTMAPIHVAAEVLNYEALRILLAEESTNVNAVDEDGRTALHYAAAAAVAVVQDFDQLDKISQHSESAGKSAPKEPEPSAQQRNSVQHQEQLDNSTQTPEQLSDSAEALQQSDSSVEIRKRLKNPARSANRFSNLPLTPKQHLDNLENCIRLLCERMNINLEINILINTVRSNEYNMNTVNLIKDYVTNLVKQSEQRNGNITHELLEYLCNRKAENFISMFSDAVESDREELLSYKDGRENTLLQLAIEGELVSVVQVLLESGADPSLQYNKRPPLVMAAKQQNIDILKLLLKEPTVDVDATDMKGDTALHHAVKAENLECSIALLNHGASIDKDNVLGKTPLSVNGLKALLDLSLQTNDKYFPQDEEYEVIFDYTLITANKSGSVTCVNSVKYNAGHDSVTLNIEGKTAQERLVGGGNAVTDYTELKAETKLLHYISENYKSYKTLLDHPIISSFLQFKWDCVKVFFYINLVFFVFYFIALNCFIMSHPRGVCICKNETNTTNTVAVKANNSDFMNDLFEWIFWILVVLVVPLTLREFFQLIMSPWRYFNNLENCLDISILSITWVLLFVDEMNDCLRSKFNVIVILLSSVELIMLIGRCPTLSRNIEMLKAVSKSYVGFLFSYIFLILAFSHCLFIVFRENMETDRVPVFLWALCRTIVFMTGEYEAKELPFHTMPFISIIVFLLFVFFISIVLLNLLIGLSVNDTRTIQDKSKFLCIISRIRVIYEIESLVLECYKTYKRWFPQSNCLHKCFKFVILFPKNENMKRVATLPNKEGSIKDNQFGLKVKVDNNILEEALKMISSFQQNVTNDTSKKYETWETSLIEMLAVLKQNSSR